MNRRSFVCRAAATMLVVGSNAFRRQTIHAQEATPAAALANPGVPDAVLVVDDQGFTPPTGSVAGRTLLTV